MTVSAAITGIGCVTALGPDRRAFARGLREGRVAISEIRSFDTRGHRSGRGAEVRSLPEIAPFGLGNVAVDRSSRLALSAAAEALAEAGLPFHGASLGSAGICLGGSTAGMPEAEVAILGAGTGVRWAEPATSEFLRVPVGSTADQLAAVLSLHGPVSALSTACSSSANALGQALDWIRSGTCDVVLAGGADSLCRLTLAGFNSLGVVAPDQPRPFDARRQGMVLGEGAAVLVLESEAHARARGARVLARLMGHGCSAEGHHIVHPMEDGSGAARAIEMALADAGIEARDVDYVNAHGTATPANDVMEARALTRVFGDRIPGRALPVSSTKSLVGHTLGASGAIEAVACVAALEGAFLPPTGGFAVPDPACDLDPVPNQSRPARVRVAISNSFAFGGNDACLVLAAPEWPRG